MPAYITPTGSANPPIAIRLYWLFNSCDHRPTPPTRPLCTHPKHLLTPCAPPLQESTHTQGSTGVCNTPASCTYPPWLHTAHPTPCSNTRRLPSHPVLPSVQLPCASSAPIKHKHAWPVPDYKQPGLTGALHCTAPNPTPHSPPLQSHHTATAASALLRSPRRQSLAALLILLAGLARQHLKQVVLGGAAITLGALVLPAVVVVAGGILLQPLELKTLALEQGRGGLGGGRGKGTGCEQQVNHCV